jgi:hypothetical protein
MDLEAPRTSDTFQRWVRRFMLLSFLCAIQAAVFLFFPGHRIYAAVEGVIFLGIGIALRAALFRLATDRSRAFQLIEGSLYAAGPSMFMGFLYMSWSEKIFLSSKVGISYLAVNVALWIGVFLFLKRVIAHRKSLAD